MCLSVWYQNSLWLISAPLVQSQIFAVLGNIVSYCSYLKNYVVCLAALTNSCHNWDTTVWDFACMHMCKVIVFKVYISHNICKHTCTLAHRVHHIQAYTTHSYSNFLSQVFNIFCVGWGGHTNGNSRDCKCDSPEQVAWTCLVLTAWSMCMEY